MNNLRDLEKVILNRLANAAGAFLVLVTDSAESESPELHKQGDALLNSGTVYTRVTVDLTVNGVSVAAKLVSIADDEDVLLLGKVEAVANNQH